MKFYIVTGFAEPGLFLNKADAEADLKTRKLDHELAGYAVFKGKVIEKEIDLPNYENRGLTAGFYVANLRA